MNHRTVLAALALAGPVFVAATDAAPPAPAPTQQSAPAAPSSIARPPPEMHAFLKKDGRDLETPLFSADAASLAVAKVDDDTISLQQFRTALAMAHGERHQGETKQHDFRPVLDRLIDIKLCALEAREMGLGDLPEVKQAIQQEEDGELILRARAHAIEGVKPAPAEVERLYRLAVRQWNMRSLLFDREPDANAFQKALRGGKDFAALTTKVVADKKAKGSGEAQYVGANALLPQVVKFVSEAKPGASKVLRVKQGWAVVQVLGTRYPDDPEVRKQAEARALEFAQQRATAAFYTALEKKYARIDRKLLKSVDFEAKKPGFAALKKDQRPLAVIPGDKPFTVADLAAGLEMKFFHGTDVPAKEHRLNPTKFGVFDTLLHKRLVLKEARALGIARSDDLRQHMAEFTDATLFAAYIERSVMPGVKVTEQEGQAYFATHKSEFSTPAMYKLESLAFTSAKDAQGALEKLRSGTDFKWLRANATGQVKDADRNAQLDGNVVSANALTSELRTQLAGTKPGDYRLAQVDAQYYVLRVVSATPAKEQRYQDARGAIGKKLIGENLRKALAETAAKLRKEHQVAVYLTKIGY